MSEIVEGLDVAKRGQVRRLRAAGRFFWIDVALGETSPEELGELLGIPEAALPALMGFGEERVLAQVHADGERVVLPFACYLTVSGPPEGSPYRLEPVEVHVLVSGDCLVTLHEEPVALVDRLAACTPQGRSEQYLVYALLDAMAASAFDALSEVESTLDDLAVARRDP